MQRDVRRAASGEHLLMGEVMSGRDALVLSADPHVASPPRENKLDRSWVRSYLCYVVSPRIKPELRTDSLRSTFGVAKLYASDDTFNFPGSNERAAMLSDPISYAPPTHHRPPWLPCSLYTSERRQRCESLGRVVVADIETTCAVLPELLLLRVGGGRSTH